MNAVWFFVLFLLTVFTGPTSWLSICSEPGLQWVVKQTGRSEFRNYAKALAESWTKRLKVSSNRNMQRATEPDREIAWKYSTGNAPTVFLSPRAQANQIMRLPAYFDQSYHASFGIVNRSAFEDHLVQHFNGELPDDPSWYALRSVVYASGCLETMSKDPSVSFREAHKHAWELFENAMSVHTELLITPTGLTAVQALTVMVCGPCKSLNSPG